MGHVAKLIKAVVNHYHQPEDHWVYEATFNLSYPMSGEHTGTAYNKMLFIVYTNQNPLYISIYVEAAELRHDKDGEYYDNEEIGSPGNESLELAKQEDHLSWYNQGILFKHFRNVLNGYGYKVLFSKMPYEFVEVEHETDSETL